VAQAAGLPDELVSKAKQSRSEKKARKAMSKLGAFCTPFSDWLFCSVKFLYKVNGNLILQ